VKAVINNLLGSYKNVQFSKVIMSREVSHHYSWRRNENSSLLNKFVIIFFFHAVTLTCLNN
jgi:hypothetical protein